MKQNAVCDRDVDLTALRHAYLTNYMFKHFGKLGIFPLQRFLLLSNLTDIPFNDACSEFMAISHEDRKGHFLPAFLVAILVASVILPTVSAVDTDGDGTDDASDDCPYAAGTSTIDK